MSVNIQTSDGLLKISGDKVTKKNINKALGYTPANVDELPKITDDASDNLVIVDPAGNISTQIDGDGIKTVGDVVIHKFANAYSVVEHIDNTTAHITAAERANWNNKDYAQLTGAPNIHEDESGQLQIADNNGNVILNVDNYGIQTHDVQVSSSTETVSEHHNNTVLHITAEERASWNSNDYSELTGAPNILEDDSGQLQVADNAGNVIMNVDVNGLQTHDVQVNGSGETVSQHHNNNISHITANERNKWNNKSDFSGDYHELKNQPNIEEDNSGIIQVADDDGNVIVQIDGNGITTHEVIIEGEGINQKLEAHMADGIPHITAAERIKWNNKSDFSGNYHDLTDQPNIEEDNSGMVQIADNDGNVIAQVDSEGLTTNDVMVNQSGESVAVHHNNTVSHITAAERTAWNAKSEFSGYYVDLIDEPDINDDGSGELSIADSAGNIIAQVDANGITAHEVTVNGTALGSTAVTHDARIGILERLVVGPANGDDPSSVPLVTKVKEHIEDDNIHVTTSDKDTWNAKTTMAEVEGKDYATNTRVNGIEGELSSHTSNKIIHITAEERNKWDNKSEFSGYYVDLIDEPNISGEGEDESELTVVDGKSNIIARIDQDGLRVRNVTVGPEDPSPDNPVYDVGATLLLHDTTLNDHKADSEIHVTDEERTAWNEKPTWVEVNDKFVTQSSYSPHVEDFNEHVAAYESHIALVTATDSQPSHITKTERESWNAKPTTTDVESAITSKKYATQANLDLTNETVADITADHDAHLKDTKAHVTESLQSKWNTAATDVASIKADYATNTALNNHKTNADNTYATKVAMNQVTASLTTHEAVVQGTNDSDITHITQAERRAWDAKQTAEQVQAAIADAGHATQTALNETDKNLTATTAKIDNHLSAERMHFSGYYVDLIGEPHIEENENGELVVVDNNGNAIMRVDSDGVRVNQVILGTAENMVDVGLTLDTLDRRLIEVGDLREVSSEFVTDYSRHNDGTARAYVETHMFETFYIHPEYSDTYTVQVAYDEWAGTVCDRRILAEQTGTHTVIVSRVDGAAVTTAELGTISNVVEHIKTAFSIYFDKLHKITIEAGNAVDESSLSFDTTKIITAE